MIGLFFIYNLMKIVKDFIVEKKFTEYLKYSKSYFAKKKEILMLDLFIISLLVTSKIKKKKFYFSGYVR